MYSWLIRNRIANILFVIIYYLAVVLPHETVGAFINSQFAGVTRHQYNITVAIMVVIMCLVLGAMMYKNVHYHPERQKIGVYLTITFLLVIFCFNVLFVINVEAIHFVQYAILAMLLFPLLKNCKDTMALAIFLGALDELYQYLVLDTTAQYFDFNDVFLDALGAGIGLVILKILAVPSLQKPHVPIYKTLAFRLIGLVAMSLCVLYVLGHFSVNMNQEEPAFFTLFKSAPAGFWYYPKGPYAKFHVLNPIPGLCLIFAVAYFYGLLDRLRLAP